VIPPAFLRPPLSLVPTLSATGGQVRGIGGGERPHYFFFTPKITKLSRDTSHNTARVGIGTLCGMG
jgi:hypothetical protein